MVTERSNRDYISDSSVRRTDDCSARGKYRDYPIQNEYALRPSTWGYKREPEAEEMESFDWASVPAVSIALDIDGERVMLPIKLRKVVEAIKEAKEVLNYDENWDDDSANATDAFTFRKAIDFLISYSKYLLKYGVIDKPFIDVLRDGSVTINWETEKASLLVVFKKGNNQMSYLFGQPRDKKKPAFPYYIENGTEIDEILALWMTKNLM